MLPSIVYFIKHKKFNTLLLTSHSKNNILDDSCTLHELVNLTLFHIALKMVR